MKNKWLLALSCLVIGMAAFTGKVAYAHMQPVSMYEEPTYCTDWSFNDTRCSASLTESRGKAAFGEPTGESSMQNFCEDWSFNTPGCPAYLSRNEGKAAYGETTTRGFEPAAYCEDWNLSDPNCNAAIR